MIVEELVATLGAEVEKGDFADAFALLDKLGGAFNAVFNAIEKGVTEAFGGVHEVAMLGDETLATAEQLSIATDALQELGYAARLSDSDAATLNTSLRFLSKTVAEAANGSKEAQEALRGIKYSDANGLLNVQDIFENVAAQFAAMPKGVEKTNLALKLFGRQGAAMIPLLNKGTDGIATLRAEARASGVVLSEAALLAGAAYDDALKRMQGSFQGLKNSFAVPVIAKVAELFEKIQKALSSKGINRAVSMLSAAFGRLVDTFGFLIDLFGWLTSNEVVVEAAIFVIVSALTGLALAGVSAGSALVGAALSTAAAWLAAGAPFILLGSLIALVVDDLYTFIEGGDSALGRLLNWLHALSAVSPEDNEFVRLLKLALRLVTDLTDPDAWVRFGKALLNWVVDPVKGLVQTLSALGFSLPSFSETGGSAPIPGASAVGGFLSNASSAVADWLPRMQLPPSVAAPSAPAAQSSSVRSTTTIHAPISINVPPGTDAAGVAEAARAAVREELGAQLQDAHAANGGN